GAAEESAPIEVGGRAALRRCLPGGLPGPFFVVVVHFRSSPKRRSDAAAVTIANGGRGTESGCSKSRGWTAAPTPGSRRGQAAAGVAAGQPLLHRGRGVAPQPGGVAAGQPLLHRGCGVARPQPGGVAAGQPLLPGVAAWPGRSRVLSVLGCW